METKRDYLINNHLRRCERESISLASHCSLVWQYWRGLVRTKTFSLKQTSVLLGTRIIQAACQLHPLRFLQTKRHFVGIVMLGVGAALCFPGSFLDTVYYDHAPCRLFGLTAQCFSFETHKGWCFMSWFVFLENIGFYIAAIFWCIAGFLFVPKKFSGVSFAVFSFFGAIAWVKVLHVCFFARSQETFSASPRWEIIFSGIVLAIIGLIATSHAMDYWENHKKRGNWQKWPAIFRSPLSQDEKNRLYELASKEYDDVNQMI